MHLFTVDHAAQEEWDQLGEERSESRFGTSRLADSRPERIKKKKIIKLN